MKRHCNDPKTELKQSGSNDYSQLQPKLASSKTLHFNEDGKCKSVQANTWQV